MRTTCLFPPHGFISVPYGILIWLLGITMVSAQGEIPAFPGAEGFGSNTPGGRNGKVYFVSNLLDYVPGLEKPIDGSLRAACEASGARTVIFTISGTIELKYALIISNSNISIFGQTAPGDGICLKNYSLVIEGTDPANPVKDVIIQHLRVRPGDLRPNAGTKAIYRDDGSFSGNDGISIHEAENVIIDHCSVSWGVDETMGVDSRCRNICIQYCIISEGLNRSTHVKGPHSKGVIIGYDATNISFHHNLIIHCSDRNPYIPAEGNSPFIIDIRNNVVYNWEINSAISYAKTNHFGSINFIGNYFLMGKNSWKKPALNLGVDSKVYASGNIDPFRTSDDMNEYLVVNWFGPKQRKDLISTAPFPAPFVTTHSWRQALEVIINHGGASLPRRDDVDYRLIEELKTNRGSLIDHPSEVGGWPILNYCAPPQDTDKDGIPDTWERSHGLNPMNPKDAQSIVKGNGYSFLEKWIHSLVPFSYHNFFTTSAAIGDGTPENPVQIPYSTYPIIIDGNLNEWKDIPALPLYKQSGSSGSCRFQWKEDGFYGAILAEDSLLIPYQAEPYKADCIELFIETDYARAASRDISCKAYQIIFSPTENLIAGPCFIMIPRDWPRAGEEYMYGVWKKTDTGYLIEFVIGSPFFKQKSLFNGMKIGLDYCINNEGQTVQQFFSNKSQSSFLPEKWGSVVLSK